MVPKALGCCSASTQVRDFAKHRGVEWVGECGGCWGGLLLASAILAALLRHICCCLACSMLLATIRLKTAACRAPPSVRRRAD